MKPNAIQPKRHGSRRMNTLVTACAPAILLAWSTVCANPSTGGDRSPAASTSYNEPAITAGRGSGLRTPQGESFVTVAANPSESEASGPGTKWHPGHYVLYWSAKPGMRFRDVTKHDVFRGAQVVYRWKHLEPRKDQYDFSRIHAHLKTLAAEGKYLVAQIQMDDERSAPRYLNEQGGFYKGRPKLWDAAIENRVKKLVEKLAAEFDSHPYFEAMNLPETSIGNWSRWKDEAKWKREAWIVAYAEIAKHARSHFRRTNVIQYVNWGLKLDWLAEELRASGAGMGGPDNHPRKQIKAYPLYTLHANKMPLAIAVQAPSYQEKYRYTVAELFDYAIENLHVNYVFWARAESHVSFRKHVIPYLKQQKGRINLDCPANIQPCLQ